MLYNSVHRRYPSQSNPHFILQHLPSKISQAAELDRSAAPTIHDPRPVERATMSLPVDCCIQAVAATPPNSESSSHFRIMFRPRELLSAVGF